MHFRIFPRNSSTSTDTPAHSCARADLFERGGNNPTRKHGVPNSTPVLEGPGSSHRADRAGQGGHSYSPPTG